MGPGRVRTGPAPEFEDLVAPEGLVGLEADCAGAQAQVAQRAMVELGELLALAGALAPGLKIWLNAVKVPASGALEL